MLLKDTFTRLIYTILQTPVKFKIWTALLKIEQEVGWTDDRVEQRAEAHSTIHD